MNRLKNLIRIRSDKDCEEILRYIENEIEDKVEEIIYVNNKEDNKSNLLVGINCKLKNIEPLVLSGHIDTVNADEKEYETNPYELVVKEDKAFGLGIIDMKCFTASVLDIIDELKKKDYPVVFAITTDEETNLFGINSIIKKLKELNIKPKFTIIGEPTSMKVNTVSNGCYEYKVEVYGKSCHSSTPKKGINAICILAKLITYIEELSEKYDGLVMNCNIINGGTIINRIPDYACVSFDIRTTSISVYNGAVELIKNRIKQLEEVYKANIKISKQLEIPPLNCKDEEKIKKISEGLGLEIDLFAGGCEAGYYSSYSGEAILFGVGELSLAHKPNEFMVIEDYKRYNAILTELLKSVESSYFKC